MTEHTTRVNVEPCIYYVMYIFFIFNIFITFRGEINKQIMKWTMWLLHQQNVGCDFDNDFFFSCSCRDDTSGEDGEEKEPPVAVKGRRTANSRGHRKGRVTRSMTNEQEENTSPLSSELG